MRDSSASGTLSLRLLKLHQGKSSRPSYAAALTFLVLCCVGGTAAVASSEASPPPGSGKLKSSLQSRRAAMLDRLHNYWTAGDFVQNPDPNGGPGHFILDGRGKPCPLASIILQSGRRDLVEEAARTNNNVLVADLRDGPILQWILASGLTKEECILIQAPSLSGESRPSPVRVVQQQNLTQRLEQVEETLRASTEKSLKVAVRRLMASQKANRDKNAG